MLQTVPDGQALPHMPQLRLSVWRSRHVPAQLLCPATQVIWHAPVVQTVPVGQAAPHAWQFRLSV
jgi:hypothetical protein